MVLALTERQNLWLDVQESAIERDDIRDPFTEVSCRTSSSTCSWKLCIYSEICLRNFSSWLEKNGISDILSSANGQVSMFKKNYDHVMKETYFGLYREATRGNPNYFLTYGNGKAAARIQNNLRPNGAHRWHNYMKNPRSASHQLASF